VETDRLVPLAEALLALARFGAPPDEIQREPVDQAELLGAASRAAGSTARAAKVRIQLDTDCPDPVRVDPDRVRQAVDNLISNAVRHAPPDSTIEVSAGLVREGDPRPGAVPALAARIVVRDRGAGFPAAFLPHAFERFSRADDARGRDRGGAGLGLAIVAAIAHAHGGDITAANHPDGGAVVTVTLGLEGEPGSWTR
jgi:signal transduction histidine kinase